ncbi:hypothetical protein UA08_03803 [Talaromyces atroroseus]|uniref:Protein NIF3-like protein n=1 Tax=Talaromyces atroroseus TaxID=1441469 RepID=A0A225AIL8_TALAT|nr:hypothetical protein UA08_03803 [Talaromyces atroroseus]OKL61281.1 hypothetical protein UA08_03803 [Talaromyces atroroseus]
MSPSTSISPFSKAVVNAMRKLYPESLADKSFDNTGLLLEAPYDPNQNLNDSVLITTDLTKAVADEAIARRDSIIVTYHPIIFRGLKSITLQDPQQTSLLRLAQAGISVYSPHTAVDAVPGGMADWLCDIVCGFIGSKEKPQLLGIKESSSLSKFYSLDVKYPQPSLGSVGKESEFPHTREAIHPSPAPVPAGFEGAGAGRIVTFGTAQDLSVLIERIGEATGWPGAISVAIPQGATIQSMKIRTVGVCPGSGGSVIMKSSGELPDLLFTGELSHHEALAAIERGSAVITLFHSNTERGYLQNVLSKKLADVIVEELGDSCRVPAESLVAVSQADRDPYGVVVLGDRVQG